MFYLRMILPCFISLYYFGPFLESIKGNISHCNTAKILFVCCCQKKEGGLNFTPRARGCNSLSRRRHFTVISVILFVQQQHAKFAMVKAKKTVCFHNHRPQTALCSAEAVEGDVENNFLRMLCCNNPLLNGLYGRD